MHLNLPILDQLLECKNLLIAGMGGGFDIFCGLPIYFELTRRGQTVHLANYSFSPVPHIKDGIRLSEWLVGVGAEHAGRYVYFPEHYLARWFRDSHGEDVTIWCFDKTGVRPLIDSYLTLIDHLSIDGILLIDGGVDSLMRGDEARPGTLLEDTISLIAVDALKDVPLRLMACLGLGAEQDTTYAQVFENIAKLNALGGFLGNCALLKQMEAYQWYEDAVLYVQNEPMQRPSVINSSVVSAVQGKFGNYHLTERTTNSKLWISPLMALYWFFDLRTVARRTLLHSALRYTDTIEDAFRELLRAQKTIATRKHVNVPL